MASEEHKRLANFIKSTHNQLREESRIYGPMEAWERHLARTEVLKNYATKMRRLATKHWNEQRIVASDNREAATPRCRNEWTIAHCNDYYQRDGRRGFDEKELKIAATLGYDSTSLSNIGEVSCDRKTIELLDVGSCYDPLGSEHNYRVTAIDIAPSARSVHRCDFLNVEVSGETSIDVASERSSVLRLGESSFDVVLFSLFLEYLPCPRQRYDCCAKAATLLRPGGLLLIVAPDSNHRGANARIVKSWRLVLARLAFVKIAYDKLRHLHCLAFRKCVDANVATAWSRFKAVGRRDEFLAAEDKIYIPQDLRNEPTKTKEAEMVVWDRDEIVSHFELMPRSGDIFQ